MDICQICKIAEVDQWDVEDWDMVDWHDQELCKLFGAVLCEDCYRDKVWTCDDCGESHLEIAGAESPILQGFERICMECFVDNGFMCDSCDGQKVIGGLTRTEDGLICEFCRSLHGCLPKTRTLMKDNWKAAVSDAITELPGHISRSIRVDSESDECMNLRVTCNPLLGEEEARLRNIKVRWWDKRWDELEAYITESPDIGFEELLQAEAKLSKIQLPSFSIEPQGDFPNSSLKPGRSTVRSLQRTIQLAVVDELFEGGTTSHVFRDEKGHFLRDKNGIRRLGKSPPIVI